jgi:hypothetical protein
MQSNLLIALAALALVGPGIALAAPMGGGGGYSGGTSGGSSSTTSSSSSGGSTSTGGGSSGGGSSGTGSSGGRAGGGFAHGGTGAGSSFASRVGGAVAGYGIHIGARNGGQGAPAIQALTHSAAHAMRIESAAHALPVEDRMRPGHPGMPKVHPHVRTQYCFGGECRSQMMPNLYCMDPRIDDLFSTPLDCPRAIKYRDTSDPGTLTR